MIRLPFAPPPWSQEEEHAMRTKIDATCAEARSAIDTHECEHGAGCHSCATTRALTVHTLVAQRETHVEAAKMRREQEIQTHRRLFLVAAWLLVSTVATSSVTVFGVAVLLRGMFRAGWWCSQ